MISKILVVLLLIPFVGAFVVNPVYAFTDDEINAFKNNSEYYNPNANAIENCSPTTTTLAGNDNEQKAYNYFRSQGLDDLHTAAVIGNLMQESHLNPQALQKGGNSQNPADAGTDPHSDGWGIAQWSPGAKVIDIAKGLNITGTIYELSTQLDIVFGEMTGVAPTGFKDTKGALEKTNTIDDAVKLFQDKFEGGANPAPRLQYAKQALTKYGGSPGTTATPSDTGSAAPTGCGPSSTLSPDCQTANGVAKILCAAKQYDPVSYEESGDGGHQGAKAWHATCPTIGPSCVLDCSGLVNIAVFDIFGVELKEITYSEVSDTQFWKRIDYSAVQPGDLIQPNSGHVEIIDHVQGNSIFTFGAHSSSYPQEKQVGPSGFTNSANNVYLHYVGPGSGA